VKVNTLFKTTLSLNDQIRTHEGFINFLQLLEKDSGEKRKILGGENE